MKITRRQLRQIIKEAIDVMNSETGEVLVFDDQAAAEAGLPQPDAPEAAALDMMKRLGVMDDAKFETGAFPEYGDTPTYSLPDDKWQMMEDELYGKRAARKSKADKERLDIDNLMDRAREWAQTVAADYMADNREFEGGLEDIAWDMSDAAEMEFKEDEWNELLYHFDFNVEDLRMFIADEIAAQGDKAISESFNRHPREEEFFSRAEVEIMQSPIANKIMNFPWGTMDDDPTVEEEQLYEEWENFVLDTLTDVIGDENHAEDLFYDLTVRLSENWPGKRPPFFPTE